METIRRWWRSMGQPAYPQATRLLITADAGGSNGSRLRLWKRELQKLADETGLRIIVCHFPPGTSKWNKIEHRLFSYISQNWRGKPLRSFETIVSLIAATTTSTGLKVHAELNTDSYRAGLKSPIRNSHKSKSVATNSTATGTTKSSPGIPYPDRVISRQILSVGLEIAFGCRQTWDGTNERRSSCSAAKPRSGASLAGIQSRAHRSWVRGGSSDSVHPPAAAGEGLIRFFPRSHLRKAGSSSTPSNHRRYLRLRGSANASEVPEDEVPGASFCVVGSRPHPIRGAGEERGGSVSLGEHRPKKHHLKPMLRRLRQRKTEIARRTVAFRNRRFRKGAVRGAWRRTGGRIAAGTDEQQVRISLSQGPSKALQGVRGPQYYSRGHRELPEKPTSGCVDSIEGPAKYDPKSKRTRVAKQRVETEAPFQRPARINTARSCRHLLVQHQTRPI